MKTAILLLVFNRAETTIKVMEAIRSAQPERLYVVADGPRQNMPGEFELCEHARKVAVEVNWTCEVKTLFREKNLGCGMGVADGINWFFEQESEGIILEDDCVADISFFRFCEELLEKYREERKVMMIGGTFIGSGLHSSLYERPENSTSYFFSKHVECWGWASWRRAWRQFDYNLANWPILRATDLLKSISDGTPSFAQDWENRFQAVYRGTNQIWDFQWVYSIWTHGGLSILPTKNLVANIGFDEKATHTKSGNGLFEKLPIEPMEFPLRHPSLISRNQVMDRWIDRIYSPTSAGTGRVSIFRRVLRRLRPVIESSNIIKRVFKRK